MSMPKNVIYVGGPGSGKSNFLFRTWLAIEHNTGIIVQNNLPADIEYLQNGSSELLKGFFAPHTSRDTHHICQIPIAQRGKIELNNSTLTVPDVSGELWLDLYGKRMWPTVLDNLLMETCGFMLFICAESDGNIKALDWITAERFYKSDHNQPLNPTGVPTQVMLVDWLQILRSIIDVKIGQSYVPHLSIIITAWDRILCHNKQTKPQDYLETEFPLFAQFILSETHGFKAKVFGSSIFGGDLNNIEFRQEVQQSNIDNCGYIVSETPSGVKLDKDILIPVSWALGLDA